MSLTSRAKSAESTLGMTSPMTGRRPMIGVDFSSLDKLTSPLALICPRIFASSSGFGLT